MMINYRTYLYLLIIAFLASACSKETIGDDNTSKKGIGADGGMTPVRISVSGQQLFDFTRSVESIVSFRQDEFIKVFVKPYGESNYIGYDYTTASSGSTVALNPPATPPYFPANEPSTVEAYAYYPASTTTTFVVQEDQTSDEGYKASDLMFAANRTVTKEGTDGNDVLTMNHQMAQLRITASVQEGSGLNIIGVTVEAKDSVRFTPDGESVTTTIGTKGTIRALNAAGTGYFLIPPQEMEGLTVKVFTGEGTDAETATYVLHRENTSDSFRAGYSYNIQLKVTANQLGTTSFVSDWNALGSVTVTPTGDLVVHPKNVAGITYNGFEHRPDVDVYKDGVKIDDTSKYTVQYVNNINAGQAFVIVAGDETDPDFKGCVGIATFTIAPAAGTVSYASNSEEKTYLDSNFTKLLSKTGDGIVTYSSSNTEVATVNETTGEVTILKSGETTITASVANGANYVYANNTATYTLTINKAAGSISFGTPTPSKTWSATTANNTYTQNVTQTGTGTVSYAIGDVNTCGATINGSTISFTESGTVQVTATVTDNDYYTYATKSVSYVLTVNRATGNISLEANSGSVGAGESTTIKVSSCHGGTLSANATSGSIGRISSITGPVDNQFTITTNGISGTSVTITVTCNSNQYYNAATATYTLTIEPRSNAAKLPLYYMAEKYVSNLDGTEFGTNEQDCYFFNWYDAMEKFAAQTSSYADYRTAGKGPDNQWHLPVQKEWWSIVPAIDSNLWGLDNGNGTRRNNYLIPIWGYNSTTKNGIEESSYWRKINSSEIHAIRFLGTEYCSAWKYVSENKKLTIYATLIETVANTDQAAANWYNSNFNNVTFDNNYSVGAVKRVLYECGHSDTSVGTIDHVDIDGNAYHQSATVVNSGEWTLFHCSNHNGTPAAYVFSCASHDYGFTVRLFLDN